MSFSFSSGRRQILVGAGACLCMTLMPRIARAEQTLIFKGVACGLESDHQVGAVTAFGASSDAERVVKDICGSVGLPANFEIIAVRDPNVNAYAIVHEGRRYIVYDENFMEAIADRQDMDWSGLAVMAHEVAHHLCGHTLDGVGSRPPRELEADTFAGFVVASLGGQLTDAVKVFSALSEEGSETHPPRRERVVAATAGWQKASRGKVADTEQFNVLSHNEQADGGYSRVIAEFVRQGPQWMEYQFGQAFASFEEGARDRNAIYLFDESRSMWVRITTDNGARTAVGSWSVGERGLVPERWTPMDPVAWR